PGKQAVAMIALDFDDTVLDRASGAAQLLEPAAELLQVLVRQGHAAYQRHSLALAPLGFATDTHYAVAGGNLALFAATGIDGLPATRAQAALIGGIDGSGMLHDGLLTTTAVMHYQPCRSNNQCLPCPAKQLDSCILAPHHGAPQRH